MRRIWVWLAVSLIIVLCVSIAIGFFSLEPLRGTLEKKINASLRGYTVQLGTAYFHPFGFSLELQDLVIVQQANPHPPVMSIPTLTASVHWRALLSGRLVADFVLDHPVISISRKQTVQESKDKIPLQERGWQEALASISPFKINQFRIIEGDFTYIDEGPFRPLHLSQLNFRASNIRNVLHPDHVYPSDLLCEGTVFDRGRVQLNGLANFLAEPHMGVKAQLTLQQIELNYFTPLVHRHNFAIHNGSLSGTGNIEYAPWMKVYHWQNLTIDVVQVTYTHTAQSTQGEKKAAQKTVQKAQEINNNPEVAVRADRLDIVHSRFDFENKEASP